MVRSLFKILRFKVNDILKKNKVIPLSLVITVTSRCNLKCGTCSIWKKEAQEEMSLSEYEKVFSSVKEDIVWLTFDGGEPFLRSDIDQIVKSAYQRLRPAVINIPSNGVLTESIVTKSGIIADYCVGARIIINLSFDGIGRGHDRIRGSKGCFGRLMKTYNLLKACKRNNLSVGINTTVSGFNIGKLDALMDFCANLAPDSYILEIAESRAEFNNLDEDIAPSRQESCEILTRAEKLVCRRNKSRVSRLVAVLRKRYYTLVKGALEKEKRIIPCFAGRASAHLFPDASLWCCGVRKKIMGNLRKSDLDFRKVWFSKQSENLRRQIQKEGCFCTSVNPHYTNMLCHNFTFLKLALNYLLRD